MKQPQKTAPNLEEARRILEAAGYSVIQNPHVVCKTWDDGLSALHHNIPNLKITVVNHSVDHDTPSEVHHHPENDSTWEILRTEQPEKSISTFLES